MGSGSDKSAVVPTWLRRRTSTFKQAKPDHVFKTYPFLQLSDIDLRLLHNCPMWGDDPRKVPTLTTTGSFKRCRCASTPRIDELSKIVGRTYGEWTPRFTRSFIGWLLVSLVSFIALVQWQETPEPSSDPQLWLIVPILFGWIIPIWIRILERRDLVLKEVNDWLVRTGYHYRTLENRRGYVWYWQEKYWDDPKFLHFAYDLGYAEAEEPYWHERHKENPWHNDFDLATFETRFPKGTPF